jgi:hypothetical protein
MKAKAEIPGVSEATWNERRNMKEKHDTKENGLVGAE